VIFRTRCSAGPMEWSRSGPVSRVALAKRFPAESSNGQSIVAIGARDMSWNFRTGKRTNSRSASTPRIFSGTDSSIEVVTARVRTRKARNVPYGDPAPAEQPTELLTTQIRWGGQTLEARIVPRFELAETDAIPGPALLVQADSATLVAPGWCARSSDDRTLILERIG
jgi:N-methylhydantoinase A/oxoprolinase/acetone carboxylase beta subunit